MFSRNEFPRLVQNFIANAFSSSVARNMGPPGTVESVRKYLKTIDLTPIGERGASHYAQKLDESTEDLRRSMPEGGRNWGPAREFLNLFFRDALYNFYLTTTYNLWKLEGVLEIPLDSYAGQRLRSEVEGTRLPSWRTVKRLTPEDSASFQAVAAKVAARMKSARVHLDLIYWHEDDGGSMR